MGRKSQEAELIATVQSYLEATQRSKPGECQLDVKSVAAVLGVSRTSLYKYGLDKLIKEAQQQIAEQQMEGAGEKPPRLSNMLADLRQELKLMERRSKALVARLNLVEANAARLGIDPEELYRPLTKPVRVVSRAGQAKKPV
ncbi:MAG: hypothetical protein KC449_16995 [Anaerolineales bacterium]|nr:hypothetical protein [Anaerolineales bacterium]